MSQHQPPTYSPPKTHGETAIPPEDREEGGPSESRSRSRVSERNWDKLLTSSTFDAVKAIYMENRFLLYLFAGYLLAHGLFGWFPCWHSARAQLMEDRVVALLRELDEVSERRPIIQSPAKQLPQP